MKRTGLLILFAAFLIHSGGWACAADVDHIVSAMEEALWPARDAVKKVEVTLRSQGVERSRLKAITANKEMGSERRTLIIVDQPASLRGFSYVFWQKKEGADVQWVYLPAIDRVRKISPVTAHESFLNTDFSYVDLGVVERDGTHTLLGEEKIEDRLCHQLETVPLTRIFYSRIVTWIDKETLLPVRRHYFDLADQLWKVETFEDVLVVEGIATPQLLVMKDIQGRTSTVYRVTMVTYGEDLKPELFEPDGLGNLLSTAFWETYGSQ